MVQHFFHKFAGCYYWSRSPTMTIFLKNLFLQLQNTQLSLQSTRNCFLLILNASLVLDKKILLYSHSEPAPNRNSEEQLCGNCPKKNASGKFRFSKGTSCSTRVTNFTLNNLFSILALLFSLINVTGVIFHFITQN